MKNLIIILFLFSVAAYAEDFAPTLKLDILKNAKTLRLKPAKIIRKEKLSNLPTLLKTSVETPDSGNVGNGGGSLICNEKRFSLDYQIALYNSYPITSSETSSIKMALILVQLEQLFPGTELTKKFTYFINNLFDRTLWLEIYYESDSAVLGTKLYCDTIAKQTIWRFINDKSEALYFYNKKQLEELSTNSDQLSWILTHEWVWDLLGLGARTRTDLIETNISLNAFLHSTNFLESNEVEVVKAELIQRGLDQSLFEKIPATNEVIKAEDKLIE